MHFKHTLGGPKMEKFCDVILMTFFGDVMAMTSLKWRHNWFFKVRFRHNQLEKTQFGYITSLPVTKIED